MTETTAIPTKAILEHFKNVHEVCEPDVRNMEKGQREAQLRSFLKKHAFFITVTFKPRTVKPNQYGPLHPITQLGILYFNIAKTLVGNHLARKRNEQPLAYVLLDFEASREGKADINTTEFPHLHCLMLVRPQHIGKFHSVLKNVTSRRWAPKCVDSIKVEQFDPANSSFMRLSTYSAKGAVQAEGRSEYIKAKGRTKKAQSTSKDHLWEIFPSPHRASKAAAKALRAERRRVAGKTRKQKQMRVQDYPAELRGFAQNKYGGQNTERLRTFGGKIGPASFIRRPTDQEWQRIEKDLRARGLL